MDLSILIIILLLFIFVILYNIIAYRNAYSMLHFTDQGDRTQKPEELTFYKKVRTLIRGVNIPKPLNNSTPHEWGLSFETHRFEVDELLSLEAWYLPHPHPKGIVIMFHGYTSSKASLLPEAGAFNKLGYSSFLVDFRGSGGSDGHETSIGYMEANDVAKAVEYIRNLHLHHPIVLYGQSMGSIAILRAVYARDIRSDAIILEAVTDSMLSTVKNLFSTMGLPSFPSAHLLVFWGGVMKGFSGFRHNPDIYAKKVDCPVLILHGSEDPRVTLKQANAVFRVLKGEKQFEIFEDVGHESCFVSNPSRWKDIVSKFLDQHLR